MKVIFDIPDELFETKQVNNIINETNTQLGNLDERITCVECNSDEEETDYFILFMWGDVEPELLGPFTNSEMADRTAKNLREKEGDEHGIYYLERKNNKISVGSFSNGFFEND